MGSACPPYEHPQTADCKGRADEAPVHEVTIGAYLLSKFELTQGQWERSTGGSPSIYPAGKKHFDKTVTKRNPVESVDWNQCRDLCRRWDLTLPTEAQWEWACRAGTTTPWATGLEQASLQGSVNVIDQAFLRVWEPRYGGTAPWDDGYPVHAPVGTFLPNPLGLFDIQGNVVEWCLDGYRPTAYADWAPRPGDGLRGPLHGSTSRVLRGASFYEPPFFARSACRSWAEVTVSDFHIGMRAARNLDP